MPLLFSALLPHSPLLIPEIGKDNHPVLDKTLLAYSKIKEEIVDKEIDSIIIISQHGELLTNSFSLGVAPEFEISFENFASFTKKTPKKANLLLADKFLEFLNKEKPCQFIASQKLDYGSAIPLELLINNLEYIKVLPIFPAKNLSWLEHYNFGIKLGEFLESRSEKVALIISGDLSHTLKVSSPGGFSPKGQRFDNKIVEILNEPNKAKERLLKLNEENVKEAKECVLLPLLIGIGALGSSFKSKKLAYQNDFGVGYLSYLFSNIYG